MTPVAAWTTIRGRSLSHSMALDEAVIERALTRVLGYVDPVAHALATKAALTDPLDVETEGGRSGRQRLP